MVFGYVVGLRIWKRALSQINGSINDHPDKLLLLLIAISCGFLCNLEPLRLVACNEAGVEREVTSAAILLRRAFDAVTNGGNEDSQAAFFCELCWLAQW